jgi:integrase/recombinase XerD
MSRKRIAPRNNLSQAEKYERLDRQYSDFVGSKVTVHYAWLGFIVEQQTKGNSKATVDYYNRFYKKLCSFLVDIKSPAESCPVEFIENDVCLIGFKAFLGQVNQQTINSYLRGFRAFGNWCEEQGYIKYFRCPIKEVDPPAKQVYTDKEIQKLLVKPDVCWYTEYRNWVIINLLLATGARENTIINIKVGDVDLEEGYILFNTTKAHKVVRLGLERKMVNILAEFIASWRTGGDLTEEDYLFANEYDEPLTRGGLCHAIRNYNLRRGVEKTSIHLFRHTFAKNWITSGGDIITLAKVLTHSELEMVKRYSNLYDYDVKSAIEQHSTLAKLRTKSGATLNTKHKNK